MIELITNKLKTIIIVGFVALAIIGCKKDNPDSEIASCEGCHTNYAHLQEVFSSDTAAPAGGCGGDAPHFEPYDRVYMGGDGFTAYKESGHYAVGCIGCHNGSDNTADKTEAHSGDFIFHPSMYYEEKCGTCHSEISSNLIPAFIKGPVKKGR